MITRLCGTLLLGSLGLTAQAQTAVQAYGVIDAFAGINNSSGAPTRTTVLDSGGLTTSFWGIRGSEALGAQRKLAFALESFVRVDSGDYGRFAGDPMFARNAWLGINDTWGELRIGRQGSPVWQATIAFNAFAGSTRFSPLQVQLWVAPYGLNASGGTVWSNALSYASPSGHALVVRAQVGLGEAQANRYNSAFSATWTRGHLALVGAAHRIKVGPGITAAAPVQNLVFAGAAWSAPWGKLYASLDRSSTDGSARITRTAHVSAAIAAGIGKLLVGWAHTRDQAAGKADTRRNSMTLGYDHPLSRRTDLYAMALYDQRSDAVSGTAWGLGVRHRF